MKAIILAAGKGTRLNKYTENLPKGMLNFNGQPLIERQVELLREAGIKDIIIVTGYMKEKIQISGVKYYHNPLYEETNMVASLMQAEPEFNDDILVCYSDILYEKKVLDKVLASKVDIGVTIDEDYWDYWSARMPNPEEDMESLIIDRDGEVVDLGNTSCSRSQAKVRYVGLIKFSKSGAEALKKVYHKNREKFWDKDSPWLRSKSFKKAYMTCILQALVNEGYKVSPILIKRGWLEFDTNEDYENYTKWLQQGILKRFVKLDEIQNTTKKIAISQRVVRADKGADKDALEQDYAKYYSKYGLILIPVPNTLQDVEEYLKELDVSGFILSGGNDVNPTLYHGLRSESSDHSDFRDSTEKKILDFAIKHKLPVLCQCRGMQFLNVYFGGKLLQGAGKEDHVAKTHPIEIADSGFQTFLGNENFTVNSFHNHCVSTEVLSRELRSFATTSDGYIEGVYHPTLDILGVMWHPERAGCEDYINEKLISKLFSQ
ncbi:MAG: gamma-glutamyl-gamma-aminobutyrate hydrolase family protein [archaeon]